MKNIFNFLLAVILFITGSCASSQYSTSRRSIKNGRVAYINKHSHDRLKLVHVSKVNPLIGQEITPVNAGETVVNDRVSEISRMSELSSPGLNDQMIASTEKAIVRIPAKKFIEKNIPQNNKSAVKDQVLPVDQPVERNSMKDTTITKGTVAAGSVPQNRKVEGFGLTGFITSIVGLFIAGIPLGIFSIVFGIVGVSRATRHPEKRNGKGFGIAAIIIGVVALVGAIIVLGIL